MITAAITRWGTPAPKEPETERILTLAAIIREVDGSNRLGAAALAEAILAHPGFAGCHDGTAAPPAPGEVPSDELMEQWKQAAFAEYRSSGEPTWRTSALLAFAWARQQQATEPAALRGVPVAVEALARLYWWGGMREGYGYDSNVVLGVRHWIDGGMAGDLPRLPTWIADRCPPLPQTGEGEA